MDFYRIQSRPYKNSAKKFEVYPEFKICRSKDLMIRGSNFYVVFNNETGLWTEDKVVIQEEIDKALDNEVERLNKKERERIGESSEEPRKFFARHMEDFSSTHWTKFDQYVRSLSDNAKVLDQNVTFKDPDGSKKHTRDEYISKELPYSLSPEGSYDAWTELVDTLYDPEEKLKIEWAIGAILSGEAKKIQKFLVFYGPQGSGKSTILNIVMKLLDGYYATFKAENLVNSSDQFGCKFLASNPLVAIDEDTNLSRIETNATINKIASHEELEVNEKYKAQYVIKPMCMMMLGTNKPVRITDAKSGIIRRLIDIEPSGRKIKPMRKYEALISRVNTELGAIAYHCMDVFHKAGGKDLYNDYIPERMMYRTDPFFNFMEEVMYYRMKQQKEQISSGEVKEDDEGISANNLWAMWKDYCQQSGIEFTKKRFEIIDEAGNYFEEFYKCKHCKDGSQKRSWFSGFNFDKFNDKDKKQSKSSSKLKEALDNIVQESSNKKANNEDSNGWLVLDQTKSILDEVLKDCPAQYAYLNQKTNEELPKEKWSNVKTTLKDIDTSKTHFVKGPEKLITIDFDFRNSEGKKDQKLNLEAANKWPPTYGEYSKSGSGIHLEYWYDGDPKDLSRIYDEYIEIKVYPDSSNSSLRRKVTKCNNLPIAHISSGLPLKEKKPVINYEGLKDEKHLRNIIKKALSKEIDAYGTGATTTTSMKYIKDLLQNAQDQGIAYNIKDLEEPVYAFAANSKNNKDGCISIFYSLDFIWPKEETVKTTSGQVINDLHPDNAPLVILDIEVIRNLTLIIYKELEPDGIPGILKPGGPIKKCIRLYNPDMNTVEHLINTTKIIGHNVTGYDNYVLYAKMLGWNSEQIADMSRDIITNGNAKKYWYEAKKISYTDTLDASSEKKSLKKIEIEMHIPHKEMEIDWSKPLPESEWERLAQYCENDVLATEAYFLSKKFQADFKARKILAALTGMTVNDSTNNLVAQLIFGDVKEPWHEFVYPNLKEEFPLYRFDGKHSYYGDVEIGEGGRVYANPGMYYNVITFDVASMHPTSIIVENGFGPYTQGYKDLYEARIAIKHKDYDKARKLFGGRLAPYLTSDEDADDLSYALKIALNSTYGMTAANFQNRFKDPRNIDNWVAKRGALFMEKLNREVQARGGTVVHIKTDSIKLVEPSKELSDFVIQFGKEHGYTFEIESKYERICLVNNAVYIALRQKDDPGWLKECAKEEKKAQSENRPYHEPTRWTATGAQFAHPFVFKRLFSHDPMNFWDFCEMKTVKTSLYLDLNEKLKDVTAYEKEKKKIQTKIKNLIKLRFDASELDREKIDEETKDLEKDISVLDEMIAEGHSYVFVGRAGEFIPVRPGLGGGLLMRSESTGGWGYATGAKGYRWLESETLKDLENWKNYVDIRYFKALTDEAIETIGQFGDFELFVHESSIILPEEMIPDFNVDPWMHPCKTEKYAYCSDCPEFENDDENGYHCKAGYDISKQILGESKEILL